MRIRTHIAALAGVTIAATALIPAAADSGKIALCHATGSDSNPYVKIVVSTAAFYNSGHVAHVGDIFPAGSHKGQAWEAQGDQSILAAKCVVPAPEPTPSESATPTVEPTVTATPSAEPTPTATPESSETPDPTPTPTVTSEPTPDPTPTVTVTASPDPQPTETVTVPAPTETVAEPGPTVTATATVTTSPDPQPTATATETLPAPVTTETVTISPAECEMGDWAESRMCETERDHPLPVETASSTQTALPAAPAKPGLPKAGV